MKIYFLLVALLLKFVVADLKEKCKWTDPANNHIYDISPLAKAGSYYLIPASPETHNWNYYVNLCATLTIPYPCNFNELAGCLVIIKFYLTIIVHLAGLLRIH